MIVKTTKNVDDEDKKKPPLAKEVHLRKIDSLSDLERDSDEETKLTKKTHVHPTVVTTVTHVNNGVTHHSKSSADEKRRLDEIEEQLKVTRIENERLRTQLSSLDKRFAVRETEDLKFKKDHDEQLKHWMTSANKQLEETNKHKQNYEKAKEELGRVKGELERHDKTKNEHEKSLKEANAKMAEMSRQLGEKEKLIVALREKHENGGDSKKTDRELEVERNLRLKLTDELEEANRKIHSLTNQVEQHEKAADGHKRSVQELSNETRLRKKQEKLLEEAKEMVNTLGKQIEEKDRQLKAEKEKEKTRRSNSQEQQEQAKKIQDDAKSKLISVTQKLEETAKELEHSKAELSKEKAQKKSQETVLLEANRKISELSRLLNEKDTEMAVIKLEHEKVRRRHSSNPFETQCKYKPNAQFSQRIKTEFGTYPTRSGAST